MLWPKASHASLRVVSAVALLVAGTVRVTEGAVDPACYVSAVVVPDEIKAILALSSKVAKKKKAKKTGEGAAAEGPDDGAAEGGAAEGPPPLEE